MSTRGRCRRNCLVPCIRADCTCSSVSTKLCVIIHNFARQLFNQLLADRTVLAASQFCHRLCNCCNHFIGIDRLWLAGLGGDPSEDVGPPFPPVIDSLFMFHHISC
jgi:hypothetical protein